MEADKANTDPRTGGLFQGRFKERTPAPAPIIDVEDGVTRCPNCSWELEDDACMNCGYHVDADETVTGTTDSEENSEMTDYNEDMEDGFGDIDEDDTWNEVYDGVPFEQLPFGVQQFYDPLRRMRHRYQNILPHDPHEWQFPHSSSPVHDSEDLEEEDDDDDEEDTSEVESESEDEDEEMDSFIVDDEELEDEEESSTDHSTVVGDHSYMMHAEYETNTDTETTSTSHHGREHSVSSELEDSSSDEDEEPIRRPAANRPQRRFHGPYPRAANHRNQRNNRGNASRPGTSASNAIPIDDDSDGPVPPTRRARSRRNQGRQRRA